MIRHNDFRRTRSTTRSGHSLVEVMVVTTIMAVFVAIPAPIFTKAIEQSKLDMAASNLRAIWCAQRYYYLEHSRYGTLAELAPSPDTAGNALLDPSIVSGTTYYAYSVDTTDPQAFTVTALHPTGTRCTGSMTINQAGFLNSNVVYATSGGNVAMTPSMEPQS